MKTDWYKTGKVGTYVVIPAGANLASIALPDEIISIVDVLSATPFAADTDSQTMARAFDFLGIDDCLKQTGYCVLRS